MTTGKPLDAIREALNALMTARDATAAALGEYDIALRACVAERDRFETDLGAALAELASLKQPPEPEPGPLKGWPAMRAAGSELVTSKPRGNDGEPSQAIVPLFYDGDAPAGASARGFAPFIRAAGEEHVRVTLARADQGPPHGGATGSHELHLPFPHAVPDALARTDLRFVDEPGIEWDPGQTGKFFGLVSFDADQLGAWNNWPGGGRYGAGNYSVRAAHWWYDRNGETTRMAPGSGPDRYQTTTWRPSLYLYLDGPDAAHVEAWTGDRAPVPLNYVSNAGHTVEIVAWHHGAPKVNTWATWKINAWSNTPGEADGEADLLIDGDVVLHVTGVKWAEQPRGWNRMYGALIFGGPPSFAPRAPGERATIDYRRVAARPLT